MKCKNEKCENGYVTEADYQHEIMIRIPCDSCSFNLKERERVEDELSEFLRSRSKEYLANMLAISITRLAYNNNDLFRLEEQLKNKNLMGIMTWISMLR